MKPLTDRGVNQMAARRDSLRDRISINLRTIGLYSRVGKEVPRDSKVKKKVLFRHEMIRSNFKVYTLRQMEG